MKLVRKENLELSDTIIPDIFVLNYMNLIELIDIKLYLYLLYLSKNSNDIDRIDLANKLGISEQELSFSIERLQNFDLIIKTETGFNICDIKELEINKKYNPKMEPKKNKAQSETEQKRIAAATAINESFFQGIMSLSWYTDIAQLFEKYGFSEEVMIALFHYCQERKAMNSKYVYAVAETWFKGGVKTFEQLEEFLEGYEKMQSVKQKISKALRLNRNFTKYEEQFIDKWINEFKYNFDVIEEALKRTVSKSNPSLNYINGILNNWYQKGYKTVKDIENDVKKPEEKTTNKITKGKQTTKYQSYEQRPYSDLDLASFYDNI